jgi:hypothetical protein
MQQISLNNPYLMPSNLMQLGSLKHPYLTPGIVSPSELFASSLCRIEDFLHPEYHRICAEDLQEPHRFHRKQWEWAIITHILRAHGKLTTTVRGLGFGVGTEPLACVFAKHGCNILGTDAPLESIDAAWSLTNEHSSSLDGMYHERLLSRSEFDAQCTFLPLNMNNAPSIPTNFDFHWSSCVIEHLGSIEHATTFLVESAIRLAPGGIAVHTTEFNLSSDDETHDGRDTCIFRMKDLRTITSILELAGVAVSPMIFDPGIHPYNYHVDTPPYQSTVHTRLLLEGYVSTSIVIVLHKSNKPLPPSTRP